MTKESKDKQKGTVARTEDVGTYAGVWYDAPFSKSDTATWIQMPSWTGNTASGNIIFFSTPESTSTKVITNADDYTIKRTFSQTGGTRDPHINLFDIATHGFETLENRLVKCEVNLETAQDLGMHIKKLEERLEKVEFSMEPQHEVVIVEEIGHDEARRRILNYIETHDEADTEDLMKNLRIDLALLVEILDELKKEGKIESIDGS